MPGFEGGVVNAFLLHFLFLISPSEFSGVLGFCAELLAIF